MTTSPTGDRVKRLLGRNDDQHRNALNLARVTGAVEDMEEDNLDFYEELLKSQKKSNDLLKSISKQLKKMEGMGGGGSSMLEMLGAAYGAKGLFGAGRGGGIRGTIRNWGGRGAAAARNIGNSLNPKSFFGNMADGSKRIMTTARTSVNSWVKTSRSTVSGLYRNLTSNVNRATGIVRNSALKPLAMFRRSVGTTLASGFERLSGMFSKTFGNISSLADKVMSKAALAASAAIYGWDLYQGIQKAEDLVGRSLNPGSKIMAGDAYATNKMTFGAADWAAQKFGYKNFAEMKVNTMEAGAKGLASIKWSDFNPARWDESTFNPTNWGTSTTVPAPQPTATPQKLSDADFAMRFEALKQYSDNLVTPSGNVATQTLNALRGIEGEIQLQTVVIDSSSENERRTQKESSKNWMEALKKYLFPFSSTAQSLYDKAKENVSDYNRSMSIDSATTPGQHYGVAPTDSPSINSKVKQDTLQKMLTEPSSKEQVSQELHRNNIVGGVARAPLPDVDSSNVAQTTSSPSGQMGDRKISAATHMFNSIMAPETGSPDVLNPKGFIRTRVTPAQNAGRHSSAWGPTQMTRGYLRSFKERNYGNGNLTKEEEGFLDKMIQQGSDMLRNPNDPQLGYGGKGYLGQTEEERKLYASIAQKSMVDLAKQSKSYGSFIQSYRGAVDTPYFRKVEKQLAKVGLTPQDAFDQLRNMNVKDAGAWNDSNGYDVNKINSLLYPDKQGLSISLPQVNKEITAYRNIPDNEQDQFKYWNSNPIANDPLHLASLDPKMQEVINRAREISEQKFVIGSGIRTEDQQKKAIEWGWSKTMDTDHFTGGAADLWPVDDKGVISFDKDQQMKIVAAMEQAAKEKGINLDVGANWKGFQDRPHFALNEAATKGYVPKPIQESVDSNGMPINRVQTTSIRPNSIDTQREEQRLLRQRTQNIAENTVSQQRMIFPMGDVNSAKSLKYGELLGKGIIEANKDTIKPPSFAPPSIDASGMMPTAEKEPRNSSVAPSQKSQAQQKTVPDASVIPHMDELKMMMATSSMMA